MEARLDPACVASWPECYPGGYDPRCCRFPKSCSPHSELTPEEPVEARLEKTLAAEPQGVQDAFKYLSELPYQLWGDYLITDPWRRLEAARWLHQQVRGVTKVSRLRRR